MTYPVVPPRTNFRAAIKEIGPPWLQGYYGYRLLYSMGIQLDAISEYLRMGVLQRMPGQAQSAALPFIGLDKRLRRGRAESDASYVVRLRNAFQTWKFAGNAPTLIKQLLVALSPETYRVRYVVNGITAGTPPARFADWWTIESGDDEPTYHRQSVNNWNWDDTWDQIRFWVILYGTSFTPWYWGDGHTWGGGQSWGFEEDGALFKDMLGQTLVWKCAGSHAWRDGGIIVTTDDTLFDPTGSGANYPDGTWGDFTNRAAGALYLGGI